jgi:hypothetical protein
MLELNQWIHTAMAGGPLWSPCGGQPQRLAPTGVLSQRGTVRVPRSYGAMERYSGTSG